MNKRALLLTLLALVIAVLYFGSFVDYGINIDDEGTLLYQIERTADGQTPYTDFHVGYTPATFYVHAAVMRAFGYGVIPIRWLLVGANALSVAALVLVTSLAAPLWLAWLPGALYMVAIPVHAGEFASFNIPYPAWYNTAFFLASIVCLARFAVSGSLPWLAAGSLVAAIDFMFKPNVGLFNLAGASLIVLSVVPMHGGATVLWKQRFHRLWWWGLWWATVGGIWLVFAGRAGAVEVALFLVPMTVAALAAAWRSLVALPTPGEPGIAPASLLLVGAFAAINIPWMIPVHALLGTEQFLEKVFFIGADFEQFYFIEHPHVATLVAALFVVVGVLAALPAWLRSRRVPADLAVWGALTVIAVIAAAFLSRALMPEGFFAAVRSEFEVRVFAVTIVVQWIGLLLWMGRIGNDDKSRVASATMGVLVIGALAMYLQLYPRSDYMHWVTAAPLSVAVAAVLVAALVRRLEAALSHRRRLLLRVGVLVPLVATVVLRAAPALDAIYDWDGPLPHRTEAVRLLSERAPVWTNAGRAARYANLSALLEFLHGATKPTDAVFTFPSLDVVSFLSDRNNPTRHGYFYPRWPGHDVEAEVLATLERDPPEFAVVLDDDSFFFFYAPVYYYALREFIESNYRPYVRYGRYVVLRRGRAAVEQLAPSVPPAPTPIDVRADLANAGLDEIVSDLASVDRDAQLAALDRARELRIVSYVPELAAVLRSGDAVVRDRAVWALFDCDDSRCSRALAEAVRRRRLSVRESVLALRAIGRSGDESAVADLLAIALLRQGRLAEGAATSLFHVATREIIEPFRFAHADGTDVSPSRLPKARGLLRVLRAAIDDEQADPRIRTYAIWASAELPDAEVLDRLAAAANSPDREIGKLALLELARRGAASEEIRSALELLAVEPYFSPTILLAALPASRDWDHRLAGLITTGDARARVEAIWLAAMIGKGRTERALIRSLQDPDPNIRGAAIWALHHRGDRAHAELLEPLRNDPEYRVRAFAERALRDLRGEDP